MPAQNIPGLPGIVPRADGQRGAIDLASPPASFAYQRLAAGGIALLLFAAFWGAWVLLIGFRPCSLSSLLWH